MATKPQAAVAESWISLHHRPSSTCSTAVAGCHTEASRRNLGDPPSRLLNRLHHSHLERAAWESEPQRARNCRATRTLTPAELALVGAERASPSSHLRERARFPEKPIPRTKQGPERFRQDLKGVPALGIPTSSHTRASGELGRSASLLGPGFVSSSHCGFPKGLKKKKQIRVPAVGMPEVFWTRGNDLPK